MTSDLYLWAIAAVLTFAVYRGIRAAWYVRGLHVEEQRLDRLRRRIGIPPPAAPRVRRLLGWLRWLTTGIALAGAYFAGLLAYRLLTSNPSPDWLQPVSAAVVVGLLLTGDFIASRLRQLEEEGRQEGRPTAL